MCPLLTGDALVGLLHPSPKRQDLHRDGRYDLHCFPADENEDAFMVSGRAVAVADPARREAATATGTPATPSGPSATRSPASGEDSPVGSRDAGRGRSGGSRRGGDQISMGPVEYIAQKARILWP